MIQKYFTYADNSKDWHGIWIAFAAYALVVAAFFVVLFKHKHVATPREIDRAEAVEMTPR
jgi:NHS family xanthosine MFS transporter